MVIWHLALFAWCQKFLMTVNHFHPAIFFDFTFGISVIVLLGKCHLDICIFKAYTDNFVNVFVHVQYHNF